MTVKILDPDLSCNYSICGTDTHLCTVAFIASPSVLVHVQEKRVQKLLLACIDIEDRCRYERVSGNPMRAQVPQTQCCHRIRHRLYPPRGWCAAIGVTSPVTRPNWPISFHHAELWKRVLCQALSSVTALEWRRCFEKAMKTGAIEMPLIMICSVHLMWMPQFDNSFSYGNFNNTERHFFLLSAIMQACCSQPCCSAHWYGMGWWHCMIAQMMSMSFVQITSRRWCWTVTLCGWWSSMHLGEQLLHSFTQLQPHLGYSSTCSRSY